MKLLVRINSVDTVVINVDTNVSGAALKKQIKEDLKIKDSDFRIIFQGEELSDTEPLSSSDLYENTVLHIIEKKHVLSQYTDLSALNHNQAGKGLNELAINDKKWKRSKFFVFCKFPCNKLQPGKLRVCCNDCKDTSFIVQREPNCWTDVLVPDRITGVCSNSVCGGSKAKFIFRCADSRDHEGEISVVLNLIKINTQTVPCITCMDVCEIVLVFPCNDGHVICVNCFSLYCLTKLDERAFIVSEDNNYTVLCPAGCSDSAISEVHHFRLLGVDQYKRYQKFATENYLLKSGGVLCPSQGCGLGMIPEDGSRRVHCPSKYNGCGKTFCKVCLNDFHDGDCNESTNTEEHKYLSLPQSNIQHARWERLSKETIRKTSKRCPNCKVPTEHGDGCMHMICSRCKVEWCFLCCKIWSRDCMADHWFGEQ